MSVPEPDPGSARLAPSAPPARRSPRRARASRLLLESALIVLSVLLGFALTQWGEQRKERATAAAALENFRREIGTNLAALERVHPKHQAFTRRLAAVRPGTAQGETAFDVVVSLLPEGGLDTPPLREAAWEAAVSTGALRLLDYETAALLSETYLVQRLTLGPTLQRFGDRFMDTPNFDPRSRDTMVRVHHMLLQELTGQEGYLIETYRKTLRRLPPARR